MLRKPRPELARLAVFGITGTANTAACFAAYAALIDLCGWHYNVALVADYVLGAVLGFAMHRLATFGDRRHLRFAFSKYVLTLVAAFGLNFVLLDAAVERLGLGALMGQAVSLAAVTLVTYALQTHWVFRSHSPASTLDTPAQTAAPNRATSSHCGIESMAPALETHSAAARVAIRNRSSGGKPRTRAAR